jgi:hypothetical protein
MVDDNLDALIDDVAKTMTAAPVGPELARRVSVRIEEEANRRAARVRMPRPWVLVPVASACVLLLAVFVARERRVTDIVRPTPAPTTPFVGGPLQGRQDAAPEGPGPRNPRVTAEAGDPERVAPQMQEFAPIEVDRLDVQPLVEMDEIQISPIAIDRIEITAMP